MFPLLNISLSKLERVLMHRGREDAEEFKVVRIKRSNAREGIITASQSLESHLKRLQSHCTCYEVQMCFRKLNNRLRVSRDVARHSSKGSSNQ